MISVPITTKERETELDLVLDISDLTIPVGRIGTELGLGEHIAIDGRPIEPTLPVSASGLIAGALLTRVQPGAQESVVALPVVTIFQVGGLAAGGWQDLAAGRHAVGAIGPSRGELRSAKVTSARFFLDVSATARVVLEAGSSDHIVIDGAPVTGPTEISAVNVIDVGSAQFRIAPTQPTVRPSPNTAGLVEIPSAPSGPNDPAAVAVRPPETPGLRRRERAALRDPTHPVHSAFRAELLAAQRQAMLHSRERVADAATLRQRLSAAPRTMWSPLDPSSLLISLGFGDVAWARPLEHGSDVPEELTGLVNRFSRLPLVPLTVDLLENQALLTLAGPRQATLAMARWIVMQLASRIDPTSLSFSISSATPELWEWTKWLPHSGAHRSDLEVVVVDGLPATNSVIGRSRAVIRIVDELEAMRVRTPLVAVDAAGHVNVHGTEGLGTGLTESTARAWARKLAPFTVPEPVADDPPALGIEHICGLREPGDLSAHIARNWRLNASSGSTLVPFGSDRHGLVGFDLNEHRHVVISGPAGSGRSTALNSLLLALALTHAPEDIEIIAIDAGSEGTFDDTGHLMHVCTKLVGLRSPQIEEALARVEIRTATGKRTVIFVDDATTLCAALPYAATALARIGRQHSAGGPHLVLASRRPEALFVAGLIPHGAARLDLGTHNDPDARLVFGTAALSPAPRRVGQARWSVRLEPPVTVHVSVLGALGQAIGPIIGTRPFLSTPRSRAWPPTGSASTVTAGSGTPSVAIAVVVKAVEDAAHQRLGAHRASSASLTPD